MDESSSSDMKKKNVVPASLNISRDYKNSMKLPHCVCVYVCEERFLKVSYILFIHSEEGG